MTPQPAATLTVDVDTHGAAQLLLARTYTSPLARPSLRAHLAGAQLLAIATVWRALDDARNSLAYDLAMARVQLHLETDAYLWGRTQARSEAEVLLACTGTMSRQWRLIGDLTPEQAAHIAVACLRGWTDRG